METFHPTIPGHDVLVLVVEDERVSRRALAMLLAGSGYMTEAFGTAEEAIGALARGNLPRMAVVDLDLPGMSGADFLEYLSKAAPVVHPVIITGASEERLAKLVRRPNVRYLRKPIDFSDLLRALSENLPPN